MRQPEEVQHLQDMRFQRREWIIQRVLWVVILAVPVCALAGLLGGPGGVASKAVQDGPLVVRYESLARLGAPTSIDVEVDQSSDSLELWVSNGYLDAYRIDRIVPEPKDERAQANHTVFEFDSASGSAHIRFDLTARRAGAAAGQIGVAEGGGVAVRTLVLP
jgi:hypothetical protein